jgi:hypothetical protein
MEYSIGLQPKDTLQHSDTRFDVQYVYAKYKAVSLEALVSVPVE